MKVVLDEVCGKQVKDFVSTRAFQNHHRNHTDEDITRDQCSKRFQNKKKFQNINLRFMILIELAKPS